MAKPLRKTAFIVQDTGRETILYNSSKKVMHVLNPTAKLLWELCDGNHTIEDMEKSIRSRFSVGVGCNVLGDIRRVLDTFAKKGVLEQRS